MKIKAVFTSLFILSCFLMTGCTYDAGGKDNGENTDDSSAQSSGTISDEDALSGLKTSDAGIERIGVVTRSRDNTLIGWGLGRDKDSLDRPLDAVNAQKKYCDASSRFIDDSGEKLLYLTFDEGYENGYTGAILDTLKEKGVKAAFFVTYDYCVSSPELVKRMIAEGHSVGNHSYSHPSFPSLSPEEVKQEVSLLHDYVKENFGYEMTLFRFPKGEFSESNLYQLKDMGYTSVFWSFAYMDWDIDRQPSAAEALDTVTGSTHSGGIYLLHAVSEANAESLSDIISYWENNGYRIEAPDKLRNVCCPQA